MTAVAATRERPASRPDRDGFGLLLHAEWTKFRTVRGWVIGMIVAAVLMVAMGLLGSGHSGACQTSGGRVATGAACLPAVPLGPGGEPVTDAYYLLGQPLAGHGSITVRLTSLTGRYPAGGAAQANPGGNPLAAMTKGTQPWSKAGVIIAASARPGAAYAAMMITGSHGVRMQYDYTADIAGLPGAVSAASPRWLRLTRAGDVITGYESAGGTHWSKVGTAVLAGLPATARAGMFVTSPQHADISSSFGGSTDSIGPSVATGVFDHVRLTGAAPAARWAGQFIGGPDSPALGGSTGFRQAGSQYTVTGSGDIAPVTNGEIGSGLPTTTIAQHLAGTFAGLIAIGVIAAMFITAEYRRGLVRTTLAASPRRGRMLAAKAVVIAAVTFAAGLIAAVIDVLAGVAISRRQGQYVIPAAWPTELRVIAGTAALLAVAAVLALAVGTMLRRSAAAIAVVIVAIVLPYILGVAAVLPLAPAEWLLRLTPAAAFAIQQAVPQYAQVSDLYTPNAGYFPLAPWAGFAVLCGYTALALAGALVLLRRRDA